MLCLFLFGGDFADVKQKKTDNAKIDDLKEKVKRHPTFFDD